jgi:long-chain acyl-CoA synthetase
MSNSLIDSNICSIADFIEQSMAKYSDKPAYHCIGQTLTFSDLEEKSRALACWFQQHSDLEPGDRIVIQLPNLIQYPIAVYAALRAGLIIVNTNPLYTTKEMQHQFSDSGAKAIIILEDLLPKLDQIKAQTEIDTVIVTSATDLITDASTNIVGCIGLNEAITKGKNHTLLERPKANLDDFCVLQYTGGTTGVSKGAALTNRNILSNSAQVINCIEDSCRPEKEILVGPLPLYHIYAFTVNMIVYFSRGNASILIPNPRDIDGFIKSISPFKFTCFAGINTLFVGLCQHPAFKQLDFSSLKLTISGGSALTSAALNAWREVTGCSITEGYGLSETSPVLCFNKLGQEQLGTVGFPVSNTIIQLRNSDNVEVADGEEGEITAKGPQVMQGYWQRPDETAKVMTSDGFFKTGDIGVRLPNGCIKIVDRLKDMIIVSGFNVYPNEVEEALVSHENIVEAAVIGEPDDKTGERVVCYITVNKELSTQDVIGHCREVLTAYKVPKQVNIMEELPKSSVGKILRRELRS